MADVVNRIVPSSVALDHASWRGREKQRNGQKENRATTLGDESVATREVSGGEAAPKDPEPETGRHVDVSV
jgi:hypothetical protein